MEPTAARRSGAGPLAGAGALPAQPFPATTGPQLHQTGGELPSQSSHRTEAGERAQTDVGAGGGAEGPRRADGGVGAPQPAAGGPGASGSGSSGRTDVRGEGVDGGGGGLPPGAELATFGWAEQAAVVRAGQKDELYAHELLVSITGAESQSVGEFVLVLSARAVRLTGCNTAHMYLHGMHPQ